jgi:hypothetical protein
MKSKITISVFFFLAVLLFAEAGLRAQCIDCGTGADGIFLASNNTNLAGGTYNYSSFTINAGVTVSVTGNSPLIIYCTGAVNIQGTLSASGGNGANGITFSTYGVGGVGVAGGANGGDGVYIGSPSPGSSGSGTGAGGGGAGWSGGGGGGYSVNGNNSGGAGGFGGISYGNIQISPVVAGSGGGGGSGGNSCGSGGGGAGGGVISIAACGSFTIGASGSILCNGGNGGTDGNGNCGGGGGGSGGSIWLIASTLNNMGVISAIGGLGGTTTIPGSPYWGDGAQGASGRIRIDYFSITGAGTISPAIGYTEVPSTLSVSSNATSASCYGACDGTVSANILSGTPPYTYVWSNGCNTQTCSSACAGTYTVTVTDFNGCTNNVSAVVTQPGPISVNATSGVPICANACATLTANATGGNGSPFTYSWSPVSMTGQNIVVCPGVTTTYTCVASDSFNCTGTATTTLNVLPLPTLSLNAQMDTVCINSTINILFDTPSGGNYFGTGVGGNNFNASLAGPGAHAVNYRFTGSNGCADTITISIFVDLCTGMEEPSQDDVILISPNPAGSELKVQSSTFSIERFDIYSAVGEKVFSYEPVSGGERKFTINLTEMSRGIYVVKILTEKGTATRKIVIER